MHKKFIKPILFLLGFCLCAQSVLAVDVSLSASGVRIWGTYTLTLGGTSTYVYTNTCNVDVSTPAVTVSLEPNQHYTMVEDFNYEQENSGCGTSLPSVTADSCHTVLTTQIDAHSWDVIALSTRTNELVFDNTCCVPADGYSTTTARISGTPLAGPFSWSVEGNASIVGPTTNEWAIIKAGTKEGSVSVRVQVGTCPVEGSLELCSADDGSGSGSGGGGSGGSGGTGGAGGNGGDGGCSSCKDEPGQVSASLGSLRGRISLGLTRTRESSGALTIYAQTFGTNLYYASSLEYNFSADGVTVITNVHGIRQVLAYAALANVVSNSSSGYTIEFFSPNDVAGMSNGLYLTANSPFALVRVENPEAGLSNNKLRLIEIRNGEYKTNEFQHNGGWQLTSGNGLRVESLSSATNGGIISVTREVRNSASQLVWTSTSKYQDLTFGRALIERTIGNALTNSYTYYSNGYPQQILHPDGNWDYFVYDDRGRVTNHFSAWGLQGPTTNSALCRVTEYSYAGLVAEDDGSFEPNTPRTTIERITGNEVSRRYAIIKFGERQEIVCQTRGALYNAANNLVTRTLYDTNRTGYFYGRPTRVWHPASKMSFYEYSLSGGNETVVVSSGMPDWYYPESEQLFQGTRETRIVGSRGELLSRTNEVVWLEFAGFVTNIVSFETYSAFDENGSATRVDYSDGTFTHAAYGCCGLSSFTNRDGTVTSYDYDAFRRRTTTMQFGITTLNVLDPIGNVLATVRYGTNGTAITNQTLNYDTAGRLISSRDALGNPPTTFTNYLEPSGYGVEVTLFPDGGTLTNRYFRDGLLYERTGTATFPETHVYAADTSGLSFGGVYSDTVQKGANEWVKTYSDMIGRTVRTVFSSASGTNAYAEWVYDSDGVLSKQVDADGVTTLYRRSDIDYYGSWEEEYSETAIDMNRDGVINNGDRTSRQYINYASVGIESDEPAKLVESYEGDTWVRSVETSLDGLRTWTSDWGGVTERTISYPDVGQRLITTIAPDDSYSMALYLQGRLMGVTNYSSIGTQISATAYGYDAHGRQGTISDARNGTTTLVYNDADQVVTNTTPAPAQSTVTQYDNRGHVWKTTYADNTSVTNEYHPNGLLKKTYGSRAFRWNTITTRRAA